jgi:microcystin-dependent protein
MDPFIGQVCLFGFDWAPRGWAQCNGQLLSIAQNSALFSLLGTTYGGDGRTTFALPDLRGRVALNQGTNPSGSNYVIGQMAGTETVTLLPTQMPSHNHGATLNASNGSIDAEEPSNALLAQGEFYTTTGAANQVMKAGAVTTANAGGGAAHNNMQPFLALNYCISLQGIFPSRP